MYIIDNIAYAGEPTKLVSIKSVRALDDYKLLIIFTTGERKVFDFKPLLDYPAFMPLRDKELFATVYLEYGVPTWDNRIDISPEKLYSEGIPA